MAFLLEMRQVPSGNPRLDEKARIQSKPQVGESSGRISLYSVFKFVIVI